MRLADGDGFFRLSLLGRGSAGWIVIEVEASVSERSWTAADEALETRDVRDIVRWLRAISRGRTPNELGFTEPNLRFECLSNETQPRIRIWFEGELRPEWAPYEHWDMDDLWLDLELQREDLAAAADALTAEIERFERA